MQNNIERRKSEDGFSLIEILVAGLFLIVAVVAILSLLPHAYTRVSRAGDLSVINHLGQQKIDELRSLPYTDANLAAGASHFDYGEGEEGLYTVKWDVVNDSPSAGMKSVTVEVGFKTYDEDHTALPATTMGQTSRTFRTIISSM